MPRIARVVVEGIPHHVIQRGNRNQQVFFSDEDRRTYLEILKIQMDLHRIQIWAWCLMDTHVHFVAVPSQREGFHRAFAETHRLYSRRINFREGWRGYLFQGRFLSFPMDEKHLYASVRYVENNPVRAGITPKAEDFPWSSARAHVLGAPDPILSRCYLEQEMEDWGGFLRSGTQDDDIKEMDHHARTGRPLGDVSFIDNLERLLGRRLLKQKPGPRTRAQSFVLN